MPRKTSSFVSMTEEIIDLAVDETIAAVDEIAESLSPDGRALGTQGKTRAEQLDEYLNGSEIQPDGTQKNPPLHGNVDGWIQWLRDRVTETETYAEGFGEGLPTLINPWAVASRYALTFSATFERQLAGEMTDG